MITRSAGSALAIHAAVALVLLLVGFGLAGRPLISYASSASMTPTLGVGDAFFVNPYPSDLERGQIVVFESVIRNNALAVHRIVGGDARTGFYTRGDANPVNDQDVGEPLVTPDRIRGRVITGSHGEPLVVPNLGIVAIEAQGKYRELENAAGSASTLRAAFFALISLAVAIRLFTAKPRPRRASAPASGIERRLRRNLFPRGLLGKHVAFALLCTLLLATYAAASTSREEIHSTMVVMDDPPVGSDRAAQPGHAVARRIETGGLGLLPATVVLEPATSGIRVPTPIHHARPFERVTLDYEEVAGAVHGLQEDTLRVWRYPALMPDAMTIALHERAPGSPYAVIALALTLVGYLGYRALGISHVPIAWWLGIEEEEGWT